MFYQCLGSINLIIVGYSYVIRIGLVFSMFFTHEQDCCCTDAPGYVAPALSSMVYRMFISNRSSVFIDKKSADCP